MSKDTLQLSVKEVPAKMNSILGFNDEEIIITHPNGNEIRITTERVQFGYRNDALLNKFRHVKETDWMGD